MLKTLVKLYIFIFPHKYY